VFEERIMSLTTHTITNTELQRQVEEELRWDPAVASASIGVIADRRARCMVGQGHHEGHR
jgi:hypothetical protein